MSDEVAPGAGAAVGLDPGTRFKCTACGNLTRFDVAFAERGVRFWHADVAGDGRIESVADHHLEIESVTCRWCSSVDHITIERTPLAEAGGSA